MKALEGRTLLSVRVAIALGLALISGGCASGGAPVSGEPDPRDAAGRAVQQCKAGDTLVDGETDCLQDDAACYPLASGGYCTGERGNTCPAGSTVLPAGAPCPPGTRCFRLGESLECAIPLG